MYRNIEAHLVSWKEDSNRRPLLIRGARQVGKSFTVEKFGQSHYESSVTVDFDINPNFASCFSGSLEPAAIIASIAVMARQEIVPGKTLLFLDEIQQCPRAILALRYFHEKMPKLHVIGAGSLLEFALSAKEMRMPVGRIQYLFMYPLSFAEFLEAAGEKQALERIRGQAPGEAFPEAVHQHLLSLMRIYMVVGGMPAVVREYCDNANMTLCARIQSGIAQTYRDDFGKYAKLAALPHLQKTFAAVPKMVGRKFKYTAVDDSTQARDLKAALELLEKAGVVSRIRQTSGAGLPMEAGASERNFKVLFLDVGLMQNMCGVAGELLAAADLMAVHAGAVAEQMVGQELRAHGDPYLNSGLYYWAREARTSNAEVDYLFQSGSRILPLEVKAGKSGTLRSLHVFLEEFGTSLGLRVSQANQQYEADLFSIPFYALEGLGNSVSAILKIRKNN